jgi:ParB family transcriptional regulator, chromosome partitioning protein
MVERRLGRGLDFLISGELNGAYGEDEIVNVPVHDIQPNPFQPRHEFRPEELQELAASIREHGVLQPILVRRVGEGAFELVAGERRWRACQSIERKTIPAVVREADDTQMLEFALIENVQRENLNSIEVARGYAALMDRLGLTQQEAAHRLGKSRSGVANTLRLLELPRDLQDLVSRGTLSAGHARALLALPDVEAQRALARRVQDERLSVREVESAARSTAVGTPARAPRESDPHLGALADQLKQRLGTRVQLKSGRGGKGKIVIDYFSAEELDRLLEILLAAGR